MNAVTHKEKALTIIYDDTQMAATDEKYFDVAYWRSQQALRGTALGRGNTWFLETPFGELVLRQYLRGGWAARVSRDRYFFTTVNRSRPFREFRILAAMLGMDLPVPKPVAAVCRHGGFISTGALLTKTICDARTLADLLPGGNDYDPETVVPWVGIGKCIQRFHRAGVWHADLNARNVLLDSEQRVYLIDFDRARLTPSRPVSGKANLARLNRSLNKLWPATDSRALQPAWDQIRTGYYE